MRAKLIDKIIHILLLVCVSVSLLTTIIVIYILLKESFVFFQSVSFISFFTGTQWHPLLLPRAFGVLPLVGGSLMIVFFSIIIALPFGLLVAIYLNSYAKASVCTVVKPVLEVLGGIPTIVYGYFGLNFVTPMLKHIFPSIQVFNALSASIVVSMMILPIIASLCDDALAALPDKLKYGGYALGAMPSEVMMYILLPAARSRVGAAVVLAMSRAIGETMAVTLAAGATPTLTWNPLKSIQTITSYIVQISSGNVAMGDVAYKTLFVIAALLFCITLTMNMFSNHFLIGRK